MYELWHLKYVRIISSNQNNFYFIHVPVNEELGAAEIWVGAQCPLCCPHVLCLGMELSTSWLVVPPEVWDNGAGEGPAAQFYYYILNIC